MTKFNEELVNAGIMLAGEGFRPNHRGPEEMAPPPYALPLRIRKAAESFVVEDANRVALAYVYFEEDPGRRGACQSAVGHRCQSRRADDRKGADEEGRVVANNDDRNFTEPFTN